MDLACRDLRIAVEVDGATHASPTEVENDRWRTAALASLGWRMFRITNTDIYENLSGVLDDLHAFAKAGVAMPVCAAAPHPDPLPLAKCEGEREHKATKE